MASATDAAVLCVMGLTDPICAGALNGRRGANHHAADGGRRQAAACLRCMLLLLQAGIVAMHAGTVHELIY